MWHFTCSWHFKDSSSISSAEPSEEVEQLGEKVSPSHSFLMKMCRILLSLSLERCHAESWKRALFYNNVIFLHKKLKKHVSFLRPLTEEQLTCLFIVTITKLSISWIKKNSLISVSFRGYKIHPFPLRQMFCHLAY